MLNWIATPIRIAYVKNIIKAKHRFRICNLTQAEYSHPSVDQMFNHFKNSSSGIFVHWGVYDSGKSTAVKQLAWRLQEEAGRTVILLQGCNFASTKSISEWFRICVGIPENSTESFSTFISKPTTIIFDQFDLLMYNIRINDTLDFLRDMATESSSTEKFNFLLVLTSWERALQLKTNGYKIMEYSGRWTGEQLTALFSTMTQQHEETNNLTDEYKQHIMQIAEISGTPADIPYAKHDLKFSFIHAEMLNREWNKGEEALASPFESFTSPTEVCTVNKECSEIHDVFQCEDLQKVSISKDVIQEV